MGAIKDAITRRIKMLGGAALYHSGLYRTLLGNRAVVVLFHRVDDRYAGNHISCTRREFDQFLGFFQQFFTVVSLAELLARLGRGEDVSRLLVITFDDGYLDNHQAAAPALRQRNLPACFFIATGFIASQRVPWWDAESQIASEWMNWDQVRDLARQGFEIGAHTINHVDLGVVTGADAVQEIRGSGRELAQQLGQAVPYFTYPYGRPHQITEVNRGEIAQAGYACCLSAYGGSVGPGDDPFRLERTPISPWFLSPYQFGFELIQSIRKI